MQRSLSAAAPTANKERKGKVGPSRAPFFFVLPSSKEIAASLNLWTFSFWEITALWWWTKKKKTLDKQKGAPISRRTIDGSASTREKHGAQQQRRMYNNAADAELCVYFPFHFWPDSVGRTRRASTSRACPVVPRRRLLIWSTDKSVSFLLLSFSFWLLRLCTLYGSLCARVYNPTASSTPATVVCLSLYIYTETHPAYHRYIYTHSLYTLCIYDRPCFCMSCCCCYTDPFTFDCSPRSGARKTWLYHQIKTEGATSQTRPTQTNQHLIISSVSSLYVHNISPSSILVCRHGGVSILTQSLSSKSQLFLLFLRYILVSTIIISNDVAVDQPGMDVHRLYETAIFVSCWASGSPGQVVITESSTFPIR